jgi:adenine specific DNA methylase Mod
MGRDIRLYIGFPKEDCEVEYFNGCRCYLLDDIFLVYGNYINESLFSMSSSQVEKFMEDVRTSFFCNNYASDNNYNIIDKIILRYQDKRLDKDYKIQCIKELVNTFIQNPLHQHDLFYFDEGYSYNT